jgi:hypothetical protein
MRKRVLILLVSIAAVFGAYPAASDEPGEPHLPDLRTLTPSDFRIEVTDEGDRLLRLSNTIWNSGDGPLEVRPRHDATSGTTHALQQLFTHDEGGDFRVTGERDAGSFEFHPDHDHWHFSDFALYSLHAVLPSPLRVDESSLPERGSGACPSSPTSVVAGSSRSGIHVRGVTGPRRFPLRSGW